MGGTGETQTSEIVIPSQLSEVSHVQEAIDRIAREAGFSDEALFAIKLCLDEAVTNAIRHGNGGNPELKVTIRCTLASDHIEISICDQGQGFDPGEVPDPTLAENLERPSGRGVMLMAAYMTSVRYNDRGNCVTLVKKKDCKLPRLPES